MPETDVKDDGGSKNDGAKYALIGAALGLSGLSEPPL